MLIDEIEFKRNQNEIAVILTHAKNASAIILSKNLLSSDTYLEWNEQSNAVYEGIKEVHVDGNKLVIHLNEVGKKTFGQNSLDVKLTLPESDYTHFLESLKGIFDDSFTLTAKPFIPSKTKTVDYSNIKYLNLDGKNLTDAPEHLEKYIALEKLFIKDNLELDLLSMFNVLAKLPHLRQLQISIFGSIPYQLSHITSLESLHIEGDPDFDTLPKDIENLKNLNYVYLQSKNPIVLPPQFSDLSALEFLHIRTHEWKLPEQFYKLSHLKYLDLYKCDITIFPEEMSQMKNLETIILGKNPNRDYAKLFTILGKLPALKTIEVDISSLPESIVDCNQIENLEVYAEEGDDTIFYIPESFGNLTQLKTLSLHHCHFDQLPECLFEVTSLRQLHLTNCTFKEIPHLVSKLVNLEEISIIDCAHFSDIHGAFSNIKSLRKIYFDNVPSLRSLPTEFQKISDINELYISDYKNIENVPNHWIAIMNS
jgi:Leucine-rich repeat (LRR) protein